MLSRHRAIPRTKFYGGIVPSLKRRCSQHEALVYRPARPYYQHREDHRRRLIRATNGIESLINLVTPKGKKESVRRTPAQKLVHAS